MHPHSFNRGITGLRYHAPTRLLLLLESKLHPPLRSSSSHITYPADLSLPDSYVAPEAQTPPLHPVDATSMAQFKYLWCTSNTTVYTFLGIYPAGYGNRIQAIANAIQHLTHQIDTLGDSSITHQGYTIPADDTGIQIYAQDAANKHLTWRTWRASLQGVLSWMQMYGVHDMVMQINDGENEVGVGYLGTIDSRGKCIFSWVPTRCQVEDADWKGNHVIAEY